MAPAHEGQNAAARDPSFKTYTDNTSMCLTDPLSCKKKKNTK